MKIIFLDIDGVILDGTAMQMARSGTFLPPEKIDLLNRVCRATGAFVVVSSTWRRDSECRERLITAGFKGTFHLDWRTPIDNDRRGNQIRSWLAMHPDVTHYVIVDDDDDMRRDQKPFFVQTDFMTGIGPAHVERMIDILSTA